MALTDKDLDAIAGGVVPLLKDLFGKRDKRMEALEARLAELEARTRSLVSRHVVGDRALRRRRLCVKRWVDVGRQARDS